MFILKASSQQRSRGEGNGTPLQYSCLGNAMDGGAWWATVHGVAKSQTRLSDFTHSFITYYSFKTHIQSSLLTEWFNQRTTDQPVKKKAMLPKAV